MIEIALRELEENTFWADVQCAFELAVEDPEEFARRKAEIGLWDGVSDSDFKDEEW